MNKPVVMDTAACVDAIRAALVELKNSIELYNATIKEPEDTTIEYCGRVMSELKMAKEDADEVATEVGKLYSHYQRTVMVKRIHEMGEEVSKFSVKGLGTFSLVPDFHISIKGDSKEESKVWLVENNGGDLIQETVNASSLKAWSKRYLEANGEFPPEDIFRSYSFEYVKLTKR